MAAGAYSAKRRSDSETGYARPRLRETSGDFKMPARRQRRVSGEAPMPALRPVVSSPLPSEPDLRLVTASGSP